MNSVLTEMPTITLRMMACVEAPLAASAAAMEPASTLMTAMAGVSGPASAGDSVEVSATTMPVTTVPMMMRGKTEGEAGRERALEDQGAEGDAIRNLHHRRDHARQSVAPKARQVRLARAPQRQISERFQGRCSECSRVEAPADHGRGALQIKGQKWRVRIKRRQARYRRLRPCAAICPQAYASRQWRRTASRARGRGRSSR